MKDRSDDSCIKLRLKTLYCYNICSPLAVRRVIVSYTISGTVEWEAGGVNAGGGGVCVVGWGGV